MQVQEIVNVAILTGWEQVYPLRIYAVDDANRLKDVTKQTKCHSEQGDVLKVCTGKSSIQITVYFYHADFVNKRVLFTETGQLTVQPLKIVFKIMQQGVQVTSA